MNNKNYKIGFALPNLENPGGPVVNVGKLTEYFRSQGHEVHLFTFGKTEYQDDQFLHTINTDNKKEQFKIFKEKYNNVMLDKEFDIFIANNLRTHKVCIKSKVINLLCLFRQPGIIHNLNLFNKFFKMKRFQKTYNGKNIAAVSNCLMNSLINDYGIKANTQSIIYNPFEFNHDKINENIIENLNFPYIVTVSRLTKIKRVDDIIKAYSKLNLEHKLVILGDGPELENLKSLVLSLQLENKIIFLGWKKNIHPYIKKSSLFVLASSHEGLPTVLLEALQSNIPVVSSNSKCGPSEILTNKYSEFLVEVGNIDELSKKMKNALDNYPKIEIDKFKQFDIDNITTNIIRVIEKINIKNKNFSYK